ncbi:MAG: T9SS type A sorting domain-containing protein [Chitinophagaceae bacterium]|nr:T9SS type A sorting domain-containing protein [Chitinophagaceae bacterium]
MPMYHRAVIHLDTPALGMPQLAALGLETDHGTYDGLSFISDFSEDELDLARKSGFQTNILIHDVSSFYAHQNDGFNYARAKSSSGDRPENFSLGSYGGYYTYEEMLAILDDMAKKYPTLISKRMQIENFTSIRKEPLYWCRISAHPESEQKEKPQILYTALHHAREPGSLSQLIYFMWYLLERYEHDSQIKDIIDHTELYFIPCVNPDGYRFNIASKPQGGGLWRKNMRSINGVLHGVDLNRNYSYGWGSNELGSSGNLQNQTYRGDAPFSEPETQAVKWFTEAHHFGIALNNHTHGNMLLYPWGNYYSGNKPNTRKTPDSLLYYEYAEIFTKYNGYKSGVCYEMLNYYANGDANDWMYGEQKSKNKIISFIPEIGYSFYENISDIEATCARNLYANIEAVRLLLPVAKLLNAKVSLDGEGNLAYEIKRIGLGEGTYTVSLFSVDGKMAQIKGPEVYTNLELMEIAKGNIAFSILPGIRKGDRLKYILVLNNGIYDDTLTGSFWYCDSPEGCPPDIFPVPANKHIKISALQLPEDFHADVAIYDISGRVHTKFELKAADVLSIDVSYLAEGVYFIKGFSEEYGNFIRKVTIAH